jgi:hypothetical protein
MHTQPVSIIPLLHVILLVKYVLPGPTSIDLTFDLSVTSIDVFHCVEQQFFEHTPNVYDLVLLDEGLLDEGLFIDLSNGLIDEVSDLIDDDLTDDVLSDDVLTDDDLLDDVLTDDDLTDDVLFDDVLSDDGLTDDGLTDDGLLDEDLVGNGAFNNLLKSFLIENNSLDD